jgi:hypothetical protein
LYTNILEHSTNGGIPTTRSADEKIDEILAIVRSSERREAQLGGYSAAEMVRVDVSGISATLGAVVVMVTPTTTVSGFLDVVWSRIRDVVAAYTYGETWALKLSYESAPMRELGDRWAEANGARLDERPLAAVGIVPGMTLIAVLL